MEARAFPGHERLHIQLVTSVELFSVITEILTPGLHLKVLSRRPVREGYEFFADIAMPAKTLVQKLCEKLFYLYILLLLRDRYKLHGKRGLVSIISLLTFLM